MKKNVMLKIASVLMVAVLLTTCAISSTFAKYTTSKTVTTEARVAKFGVVVNTAVANLFAETYGSGDKSVANVEAYDLTATVEGNDIVISNLIAPGTTASLNLDATVVGKPEVSVAVTNTVTFGIANLVDTNYCPIEFIIDDVVYTTIGTAEEGKVVRCSDVADLLDKVNTKATKTATYAAGTALDDQNGHNTKIGWQWRFEGDGIVDAKDTDLGDAATTYVTLKVVTDVTQTGAAVDAAN